MHEMKYEDLEEMPEYPEPKVLEKLCILVLDESNKKGLKITMDRLDELGDKQWHTYELPSSELKERLTSWMKQNWIVISNKYLIDALGISYGFALSRSFFKEILDQYNGEGKKEFIDAYNNSTQDYIDPWWTLGPRTNKGG